MPSNSVSVLAGLALVASAFGYHEKALNEFGTLSYDVRHSKVKGLSGVKYWADVVKEKGYVRAFKEGAPKYSPPSDWIYNTKSEPVEGKINVHIVPHTHDDTGWQVTVDQYFFADVYYILDTVVPRLAMDPNRKFIYVEVGFFARWWDQQPEHVKNVTRSLVQNKQLEFINGGWCMHDEASPYYVPMVDQTTRGHMFLKKNFGVDAIPKGTWQIDPFGHSNTEAWLIGAEAGMQYLFWGRTDFQDLQHRLQANYPGHDDNRWSEWVWQGSASLGKSARVFAGQLRAGGYGGPFDFDNAGSGLMDQVQDDPRRHDYNVDAWVDQIINTAVEQANYTRTSHQMWPCGSDFNYQNADHWYHNLDKLIHYVNQNGSINLMYSTPSIYVEAKHKETLQKNLTWEVRTDDIFPLGDNFHNYWSGYFTSRPALKKQVRFATNFLQAARQLEVIAKPGPIGAVTLRPSPVVGSSFTDSLEGTIGVATHHDGMSGTERQDVSNDYEQRISESHIEAEVGVSKSLEKLLGGTDVVIEHCNCNGRVGAVGGDCLNISVCAHTTGKDSFQIVAWNVRAHASTELLRIPVTAGGEYTVTQLGAKREVTAQAIPLTERDYELPLLYLRFHELANASIVAESRNKATHMLLFQGQVPPVGYETFDIKRTPGRASRTVETAPQTLTATAGRGAVAKVFSNGVYDVSVDAETGMVTHLRNVRLNQTIELSIDWGWYNSSTGGCTEDLTSGAPACSGQKSGAYIFRPNSSTVFKCGPRVTPTVEFVEGPLVTEIQQTFSDWATHTIRLVKGSPYVEVEWTAGPIPINQPWLVPEANERALCGTNGCQWGKEVVVRYASSLASDRTFYTDSNGREMLKRVRDARGPSYPVLNVSEPVAGNYYPVNAMIALDDGRHQLTVLTDVSQGGSSMASGELELMVHRRVQQDDSRGVQEPLNETMCGCNDEGAAPGQMGEHGHEGDGGCDCAGLTMRGRHWLIFDTIENANVVRRAASEQLQSPATVAINIGTGTPATPSFTAIAKELPVNVKLMTLTSNYKELFNGNGIMLRLAHIYAVDEHPLYSQPATVVLSDIFPKIKTVEEMSLTGNQGLAEMDAKKMAWPTQDPDAAKTWHVSDRAHERRVLMANDDESFTVTLRPMELRTLIVTFEE